MSKLIRIYILLMILGTSCGQDYIPTTEIPPFPCYVNCDSIQPEIIWKSPIMEDYVETISTFPEIADSIIIFSNQFYKGQPEIFKGFNRFSGELRWRWAFPHPELGELATASSFRNTTVYKDQFIFSIGKYYYNLDPQTGQVNAWAEWSEYEYNTKIKVYDDKFYFSQTLWLPERGKTFLCQSDLNFTRVDTLVTLRRTAEGELDPRILIEAPSFWETAQGDTLAFYVMRGYTLPTEISIELHLVNMSHPELLEVWHRNSLPLDVNCNVIAESIFFQDSILIFPGQDAVYGIDLDNGDILYTTPIKDDLITTDFLLYRDEVLFVDNEGNFHILDPWTGSIKAIIPDCGGNVSNIECHNGVAYFTSAGDGKLYAVDLDTRQKIYEWSSPHKRERGYAQFTYAGVAIDREKGYLYTSDRVYALCLALVR